MSSVCDYNCRMNNGVFRDAMSRVPTNVSVVASWETKGIRACTVSSLVSVDIVEPTIMFVLKSESATLANIESRRNFSVNVLSAHQSNLSGVYSNSKNAHDTLHLTQYWEAHKAGIPIIRNSHFSFACVLSRSQQLENATIVFAKVTEMIGSDSENPLIYFDRKYYGLKEI